MSCYRYEAWINHQDRVVLIQNYGLGVPVFAVTSSDGTIGGTVFNASLYLGPKLWEPMLEAAQAKAQELGYSYEVFDPINVIDFED